MPEASFAHSDRSVNIHAHKYASIHGSFPPPSDNPHRPSVTLAMREEERKEGCMNVAHGHMGTHANRPVWHCCVVCVVCVVCSHSPPPLGLNETPQRRPSPQPTAGCFGHAMFAVSCQHCSTSRLKIGAPPFAPPFVNIVNKRGRVSEEGSRSESRPSGLKPLVIMIVISLSPRPTNKLSKIQVAFILCSWDSRCFSFFSLPYFLTLFFFFCHTCSFSSFSSLRTFTHTFTPLHTFTPSHSLPDPRSTRN